LDSSPVSCTFGRKIKLIATVNINDTKFVWRTDTSYVNGDNYALLLSQDGSTTLSSSFSISGGVNPSVASSQPSSVAVAPAATATPTAAATPARKHIPLTKGGIVGIVIGVVAICVACSTMLIFLLVLNVIKKKGAEAAAAAAEQGHLGRHIDDEDDMSMTPLPSSTESPVVGTFYTKRVDDSTLGGVSSLSSSTSSVPARRHSRHGSAGSADLSPGSPSTLVPPLHGISLANSAATSRGGTMPGTPTAAHAGHGIASIGGAAGADAYFKHSSPRPPSASPPAGALWDDATSRYSGSVHAAVHPGAGPSGSSSSLPAAPPPTGPLPDAPPNFALPPPHALGPEPWMQLPLQMHPPHSLQIGGQQQAGSAVPPRRAVGLSPQGTGESGASVGSRRWSPPGGAQGASKLRMQME
jgi:hypothetical protein